MRRNKALTVMGTIISVASLTLAGLKLYKEYKHFLIDKKKALDNKKLDERLEESFPASDATAVY